MSCRNSSSCPRLRLARDRGARRHASGEDESAPRSRMYALAPRRGRRGSRSGACVVDRRAWKSRTGSLG
jgi:hypothetical protein